MVLGQHIGSDQTQGSFTNITAGVIQRLQSVGERQGYASDFPDNLALIAMHGRYCHKLAGIASASRG